MFVSYLNTKVCFLSSFGVLFIATKPKTEEKLFTAAVCPLCNKKYINFAQLFKSSYHTALRDRRLIVASVARVGFGLKVPLFAMLQ
jgi:hypothetical protein